MEYIIRFSVNLFDLGIFWYHLHSFKKMKRIPIPLYVGYTMIMAAIWAGVNEINNPFLNLISLVSILFFTTLFFQSTMWSRIVNIIVFVGAGMIIEPVGLVLLNTIRHSVI